MQLISSFVDWWGDMTISLANLDDILPQIKTDGKSPFRTAAVKEHWIKVHNEYVSYQRQVRLRRGICHSVLTN
jgi:hypothetical protein